MLLYSKGCEQLFLGGGGEGVSRLGVKTRGGEMGDREVAF